MDQFLQWLAGGCYLLNKLLLAFAERANALGRSTVARRWRIAAWAIYIVGLPPWVILFIEWRNWIAAFVETSGFPAMVLGLVNAIRDDPNRPPSWLRILALGCAIAGIGVSLADFGGLTASTQWLELALVVGFLVGTYQLAHERATGYLWFMLMHVACGMLMLVQHSPWLASQQLVSLVIIVDAYNTKRRSATLAPADDP